MANIEFGKITFMLDHPGDHVSHGKKITHELDGQSTVTDLLEEFEYFLKACGYHFPENEHIVLYNTEEDYENADNDN